MNIEENEIIATMLKYGATRQFKELSFYQAELNGVNYLFQIVCGDVTAISWDKSTRTVHMVNKNFENLCDLENMFDSCEAIRLLKK